VNADVNFLLSPLAWVTYFALDIPEMRSNPRKIGQALGIEVNQLRAILQSLHDLSLIEIDEDIFRVTKVNKNHFHYSVDHPLTHLHQQTL
jgi:transcription initiation factor IIE alpha subunit